MLHAGACEAASVPQRALTLADEALVREDDRSYVPLDKVDDGAIKRAGLRFAKAADEHFAQQAFVPKVSV